MHEPTTPTPTLAPVAMFVYNRLDNTRRTVEALLANHLADQTELYVFSDGGKDDDSWKDVNEVRHYLRTVKGFAAVHLTFRPENVYLERNITEGIAEVFLHHDRIVVLEDDIVTSPWFLTYMNNALDKYKDTERVWHISGFTNLAVPELGDTYFCHHMAGWGWGTWRNRWEHFVHFTTRNDALQGLTASQLDRIELHGHFPCLKSLDKKSIPWDICWGLAICKADALCLSPTQTLVRNIGLTNGTHFSQSKLFGWYEYDRQPLQRRIIIKDIPVSEMPIIDEHLTKALHDHGMRYNLFGTIVRSIYLLLRGGRKRGE